MVRYAGARHLVIRLTLLVGLLASLLADLTPVGAAPVTDALALVPADAMMVVRFAPSPGQWLRLQALQDKLATVPEIRAALASGRQQRLGQAMTVENDVLPWLGGDLALAVLPSPDGGLAGPDLAAALATRDVRRSDQFLRDLRTEAERSGDRLEKRATAGVTYYARGSGPAIGAVPGFVLLSTSTDRLKQMILTARGRGSGLGDTVAYQTVAGLLPQERLGEIYVAPAPAEGGAPPVNQVANGGAATAAYLTSTSLVWETVARYDLERLHPDVRAWVQQAPNPLRVAAALPDATLAALALRDIPTLWRAMTAVVRDDPSFAAALADFQAETGLDLENDVLSWLTGEVGLGVVADPTLTGGMPVGGVLAIEARDRPLVEAKLARITSVLAQRHKITLAPRPLDGVTAQVVDTPGPARGMGYAFAGDYLIVGSSPAMLREAVIEPGAGLAGNPRYAAVRATVPRDVSSLAVVDMVAVRRVAAAWAAAQGQTASWQAIEPWLRPLAAIGSATATVDASGVGRSMVVVAFDFEALGGVPSLDVMPVATSLAVVWAGLGAAEARLRAAFTDLAPAGLRQRGASWLAGSAAVDSWLAERSGWPATLERLGMNRQSWSAPTGP